MFVKFSDVYSADVYVNPSAITFVRQIGHDTTVVNFSHEHSVQVKGDVDIVASALSSAEKKAGGPTRVA